VSYCVFAIKIKEIDEKSDKSWTVVCLRANLKENGGPAGAVAEIRIWSIWPFFILMVFLGILVFLSLILVQIQLLRQLQRLN
jgi:hypothetical protein